jgi:hypothetical protein
MEHARGVLVDAGRRPARERFAGRVDDGLTTRAFDLRLQPMPLILLASGDGAPRARLRQSAIEEVA